MRPTTACLWTFRWVPAPHTWHLYFSAEDSVTICLYWRSWTQTLIMINSKTAHVDAVSISYSVLLTTFMCDILLLQCEGLNPEPHTHTLQHKGTPRALWPLCWVGTMVITSSLKFLCFSAFFSGHSDTIRGPDLLQALSGSTNLSVWFLWVSLCVIPKGCRFNIGCILHWANLVNEGKWIYDFLSTSAVRDGFPSCYCLGSRAQSWLSQSPFLPSFSVKKGAFV